MSSYSRYGVGDAALDYASSPVAMTMTPMVLSPTAVTTTMSPPFVGPTSTAVPVVVTTDAPATPTADSGSMSPLLMLAAGVAVGYFLFRK